MPVITADQYLTAAQKLVDTASENAVDAIEDRYRADESGIGFDKRLSERRAVNLIMNGIRLNIDVIGDANKSDSAKITALAGIVRQIELAPNYVDKKMLSRILDNTLAGFLQQIRDKTPGKEWSDTVTEVMGQNKALFEKMGRDDQYLFLLRALISHDNNEYLSTNKQLKNSLYPEGYDKKFRKNSSDGSLNTDASVSIDGEDDIKDTYSAKPKAIKRSGSFIIKAEMEMEKEKGGNFFKRMRAAMKPKRTDGSGKKDKKNKKTIG